MTCRPDQSVPKDFKGDMFKTTCYKCGRPMHYVRGKRKVGDTWEEGWIIDEEYWTVKGLSSIFETEMTVKVEQEPPIVHLDWWKK